jgi:hypothetical protein
VVTPTAATTIESTAAAIRPAVSAVSDLDPDEVFDFVDDDSMTALQLAARIDRFTGHRVRWSGTVYRVDVIGRDQGVSLWFDVDCRSRGRRDRSVVSYFPEQMKPTFLIIHKGHKVTVEGTLHLSPGGGAVRLNEPRLISHSKPAVAPSAPETAPVASSAPSREPRVNESLTWQQVWDLSCDRTRTALQLEPEFAALNGQRVRWSGVVQDIRRRTYRNLPTEFRLVFRDPAAGTNDDAEVAARLPAETEKRLLLVGPGDTVVVRGTLCLDHRSFWLDDAVLEKHVKQVGSKQPMRQAEPVRPASQAGPE